MEAVRFGQEPESRPDRDHGAGFTRTEADCRSGPIQCEAILAL